jgi:hypothetical protein
MRKPAAISIFTARRVASAVALPGMLAGMLVLAAPAGAATTSSPAGTTGVCNGVVNQLAHCGMVQPNLLKAAAKQNAAVIQQLQLQRDGLVAERQSVAAQIAAAQQRIAELDAAAVVLQGQIDAARMTLASLTEDRATVAGLI